MDRSERVFVVAWEYAPMASGESVVCQRALKYSRFQYDLCCGPAGRGDGGNVNVFPTGGNKYMLWPFNVLRRFLRLTKERHYKAIMSRVMPPNGHFAGWLIKKFRPDVKWIAYFSDPIWNSPFLKLSPGRKRDYRPNWLLMKAFGIPCKWAVKESDWLVFNNERLARYVLGKEYERYRHKVVIAPYGHGGVFPRPMPARADGKYRLTHVGQIYGDRSFKALTAGVQRLKRTEPDVFSRLEICQVGFVCEAEQERLKNSPVGEAFSLAGQAPYEESLERMYQADCLLVIDPIFDAPEKNIYIPAKIYDYMSTGRPILCICEPDSATADVARKAGCVSVPPQEDAICRALSEAVKNGVPIHEKCYGAFHAAKGTETLDGVLAGL